MITLVVLAAGSQWPHASLVGDEPGRSRTLEDNHELCSRTT